MRGDTVGVAIVKKLHRRWDDQPICYDALAQGGNLAGSVAKLLFREFGSL